jgi:hypothetical protein
MLNDDVKFILEEYVEHAKIERNAESEINNA